MDQMIAGATAAPIDVDMNNFMSEVIDGSATQPVIVQFWAPWCGPCKQLGPVMEKVVAGTAGKVKMVRVNIDENAQIAQQLRVQSVPTVYGFFQGQPVDGFTGAQPESAVQQFVDKLAVLGGGADVNAILEAANGALEAQDYELAMTKFQEAMGVQPESVDALAGVVRCLIGMGDTDGAREVIDQLNDDYTENAAMQPAIAALELAEKAAESAGDLAEAEAAVTADGNNLQARQDLAMAYFAVGRQADAMDQLLTSITIDREWNDAAARLQLLDLFKSIGASNPDVIKARRKLSTLLFS